jgi:hypothetical protein
MKRHEKCDVFESYEAIAVLAHFESFDGIDGRFLRPVGGRDALHGGRRHRNVARSQFRHMDRVE